MCKKCFLGSFLTSVINFIFRTLVFLYYHLLIFSYFLSSRSSFISITQNQKNVNISLFSLISRRTFLPFVFKHSLGASCPHQHAAVNGSVGCSIQTLLRPCLYQTLVDVSRFVILRNYFLTKLLWYFP